MARRSESVIEEEPRTHHEKHHPPQATAEGGAVQGNIAQSSEQLPAPPQGIDAPVALASFPPLGYTPTNVKQIFASVGPQATHFSAPVVSGPVPGSQAVPGAALLSLTLRLDYSMGNFTIPIQFPPNVILLWTAIAVQTAFTGGTQETAFVLGTTSGGSDILPVQAIAGAAGSMEIVPISGLLAPPPAANPFTAFLAVSNYGNTAGSALVTIMYAPLYSAWM